MVLFVAVGTRDAKMGTTWVFAGGRVLCVVSGEVLAGTLVALGGLGSADIGGVAPLKTSGALAGRGGDRPWLASSRDAHEGDRGSEEFRGD